MTCVVVFAGSNARLPSLITLLLGLMLGTVGTDPMGGPSVYPWATGIV